MELEKYHIPELHRCMLMKMMELIHLSFAHYKIKYFIEGGTALGAVREQNIILHDDDIDIGIFQQDAPKARKALEEVAKITITTSDNKVYPIKFDGDKDILKLYVPGLWVNYKDRLIGTPTIDIFAWMKFGSKFKYSSTENRLAFPNYYITRENMLPLKEYKFGNLMLWGPKNPIPCLKRYYGNDCLEKVKVDHRQDLKKKLRSDEKFDFVPHS